MNSQTEAVIIDAQIVAGHDGEAQILVSVRHENGVVSAVALDGEAGFRLMGAGDLDALIGRSWPRLLAATLLGEN